MEKNDLENIESHFKCCIVGTGEAVGAQVCSNLSHGKLMRNRVELYVRAHAAARVRGAGTTVGFDDKLVTQDTKGHGAGSLAE